jgi:hypothetical protein
VIPGGFGIFYQALGNGGCGYTRRFNGSFSQRKSAFLNVW